MRVGWGRVGKEGGETTTKRHGNSQSEVWGAHVQWLDVLFEE